VILGKRPVPSATWDGFAIYQSAKWIAAADGHQANQRPAGGVLGNNPFALCTIVPPSSTAAGSTVDAGTRVGEDPGLMSGGSVAGLTGVNAAPCSDLPVKARSPSLVETISPGRKVGSRFTSKDVSPNASLPLQVQFATSCLRYKNAVSSVP
jgi:hypothetical protein